MARIWLLSVGFSLSVGIMFARVIFTAFMELIREFKNYQITSYATMLFVGSMVIIDTLVVIAWRHSSPPRKDYVTKEIERIGLRDERRTLVETCNSDKESLLIGFLCFYKGGLLLVALIISIFKREEEEWRSKDYNQCKVGLLSVLVAGVIGTSVVLSLPFNPNRSFAVGGAFLILEVTFLMTWVKASKIFNAHKCKKGQAMEFGKYSIEKSLTPHVPCVRPVYGCVYDINSKGFLNESFADSAYTMETINSEYAKEESQDDDNEDGGMGFDSKVSEDFLPCGLPSEEDYNLKPYDPDAEEEVETDDEAQDKPEGGTSDDYTSSDSSDNEDREEDEDAMSTGDVAARSTVSLHMNKSTKGSQVLSETSDPQHLSESVGSSQKGWWKPLFKGKKEPRKPADQNNKDMQSDNNNWVPPVAPTAPNNAPNTSTKPSEETKVEEHESSSSESESETNATPKRCFTPHGGSASEGDDSDSSESDSD
ncbi:uncharacterized protein LOC114526329 isoform X2 [Dendronephthya gigantea]|nr:uncharacterized protein LOC114526329 isoform X2 [Dendronephthya gigantea]